MMFIKYNIDLKKTHWHKKEEREGGRGNNDKKLMKEGSIDKENMKGGGKRLFKGT